MLLRFGRFFTFVTLVCLLFSCNTDKLCNEDRAAYLKIGFYTREEVNDTVKIKDASFLGYAFQVIDGSDMMWIDTVSTIHMLELPLSQLADSSLILLKLGYKTGAFNNYLIKYKRSQVFINYECGFRTDFVIDTLLTSNPDVDSLYINSRVVTNLDEEHIKIFLRPAVLPAEP